MKQLAPALVCPTLIGLAALLSSAPALPQTPVNRPNILLIYADDMGYNELSCYGGKHVPTPNIDALAAGGVRCTQGYVSAPLCSPSRAGLMTGRYPTRFGHENNSMAPGGLPLSETTLANRMKALGYATGAVGKWHLGATADRLPMARGFDEYYGVVGNPGTYFKPAIIDSRVSSARDQVDDPDFYTTEAFAARAVDWIERHKDGPWFLYLPFNAIHGPREAPERYRKRFAHVANENDRTLFAMTAALDDAVGVVLDKVRSLGLEQNTLIYFISDNGAPGHIDGNGVLRGRKHTTWEGGIRLPFLMQWKGHLPAGKVYEQPVVQLDVMPTCVAAAGGAVDPSWKLDGVNLLPYLTGENPGRPHQTLYWRIDGMWAIRHGDWKLVHGQAGPSAPELFDLAADIGERHDLAAAQPERVQGLKALWDAWNAEQSAPQQAKAKAKAAKKAARKAAKKAAGKAAAGGS
jgi:arylsulfatase A-like enzyme